MAFHNAPKKFLSSLVATVAAVSMTLGSVGAHAEKSDAHAENDYPERRITIVNPFNPGGSSDRMARAIAKFLPSYLGDTPVSVVNKPGGSGALGHSWFLQQPDDGHTLMVTPVHPYTISNILRGQGDFELDDFAFINGQWQDYYVLLVNKNQPFKTAQELFQFIRENPGEASTPIIVGDAGHLSTLLLLEELGIPKDSVNYITYDGGAPMRTALAGNQVTFSIISALGSEVIRDQVRPLAVFRTEPAKTWDAPLINDVLSDYDAEIPVIAADLRTLVVQASFKEKYPERYKELVNAYKEMLDSQEFQAFLEKGAIGGDWLGPEQTTKNIKEYYKVFEENMDVLK